MASTADRRISTEQDHIKCFDSCPAIASTTVFGGTIASIVTASGNCQSGGDTAGTRVLGVFVRQQANTGAAAAVNFEYAYGHVVPFNINSTNITTANVGQNAVIFDNDTVTNLTVATNDVVLGVIRAVRGTVCWVQVGVFAPVTAP